MQRTLALLAALICAACAQLLAQTEQFRVQIAAFNQAVPTTYFSKDFPNVTERVAYGGVYRYYLDGFATRQEAEKARDNAKNLGYTSARVVEPKAQDATLNCCVSYNGDQIVTYAGRGLEEIRETPLVRNVFFGYDRADLTSESRKEIEKLARIMKKNATFKVNVQAHTDAHGDDTYNEKLSARRRDAVVAYLAKQGIGSDRILGEIFGEKNPIAPNEIDGQDNPVGRKFNRRVEFTVKDGDQTVNVVERIVVPSAASSSKQK